MRQKIWSQLCGDYRKGGIVDKKVEEYIQKQKPLNKEICQQLRKIIFKTIPRIKEEMKWGAIVFGDGKFYIGMVKHGVNLGFSVNGLNKDETALFEGNGKTMRHLKITSLDEINEKKISKLVKLVNKKAVCKKKC